jgi:N-acetylglucosaminyldiphosphoundecaprenol N-acetyl-beta-D-mannosaminyltransferase
LSYKIQILGIPFFAGSVEECYNLLNDKGGLLIAPSGPGLASIGNNELYYKALKNADIVIPDSGYMVLLWNIVSKFPIKRLSGLAFINHFVKAYPNVLDQRLFLVNPSFEEQCANLRYLQTVGIRVSENDCYIPPFYTTEKVEDELLCARIEQQRPSWIIINIGGGTQEVLGYYLKKRLSYLPVIVCTGAAIAFKTGKQVNIPKWADFMYLGWLFRIISSPTKYLQRYIDAVPLAKLIWKYREKEVE